MIEEWEETFSEPYVLSFRDSIETRLVLDLGKLNKFIVNSHFCMALPPTLGWLFLKERLWLQYQ